MERTATINGVIIAHFLAAGKFKVESNLIIPIKCASF